MSLEKLPPASTRKGAKSMEILIIRKQHNIIIYSLYGKGRKYTQAESAANYSAQRRTLLREIHKTFHLQLE
jgi:hypothetical protein